MATANTDVCYVCSKSTSTRCSGCKTVYYCNISCQRKDWKRHKKQCKKIRSQTAKTSSKQTDDSKQQTTNDIPYHEKKQKIMEYTFSDEMMKALTYNEFGENPKNLILQNTCSEIQNLEFIDIGTVLSDELLYPQNIPPQFPENHKRKMKLNLFLKPILYPFYAYNLIKYNQNKNKNTYFISTEFQTHSLIYIESSTHNNLSSIIPNASFDKQNWHGSISLDISQDEDAKEIMIQATFITKEQFILFCKNSGFQQQAYTKPLADLMNMEKSLIMNVEVAKKHNVSLDFYDYMPVVIHFGNTISGQLIQKVQSYHKDIQSEANKFQACLNENGLKQCDGLSILLKDKRVFAMNIVQQENMYNSNEEHKDKELDVNNVSEKYPPRILITDEVIYALSNGRVGKTDKTECEIKVILNKYVKLKKDVNNEMTPVMFMKNMVAGCDKININQFVNMYQKNFRMLKLLVMLWPVLNGFYEYNCEKSEGVLYVNAASNKECNGTLELSKIVVNEDVNDWNELDVRSVINDDMISVNVIFFTSEQRRLYNEMQQYSERKLPVSDDDDNKGQGSNGLVVYSDVGDKMDKFLLNSISNIKRNVVSEQLIQKAEKWKQDFLKLNMKDCHYISVYLKQEIVYAVQFRS